MKEFVSYLFNKEISMDNDNPVLEGLEDCKWIPLKTTAQEQEMQEILESFHRKLLEGMFEMPSEFNKVFVDNFEDLLA